MCKSLFLFEILQKIRELGYRGPIIGVTGNAMIADIDTFTTHGADEVLIKPMSIDDLKVVLVKIFENSERKSGINFDDNGEVEGKVNF